MDRDCLLVSKQKHKNFDMLLNGNPREIGSAFATHK